MRASGRLRQSAWGEGKSGSWDSLGTEQRDRAAGQGAGKRSEQGDGAQCRQQRAGGREGKGGSRKPRPCPGTRSIPPPLQGGTHARKMLCDLLHPAERAGVSRAPGSHPLLPPGPGRCGRGRPSQALPSPGPGEAKPGLRRAGPGRAEPRTAPAGAALGAEREGGAAPGSAVAALMAAAALLAALPRRGLLRLSARYGRGRGLRGAK